MTCPVVELRQYTLHPGRRDELIELFDSEFVETQDATGMKVLGQFRDLGNPDRFVWLRGFPDLQSRATSLAAFYGGPAWTAHKDQANATMITFDDVLLLRPLVPLKLPSAREGDDSRIVATLHFAAEPFTTFPEPDREPMGAFTTLYAENTFPALPIREDVHAYVWLTRFATTSEAEDYVAGRDGQHLILAPTKRSLMR